MRFSEQALIPQLPDFLLSENLTKQYWIAFSGGLDSHVLLFAMQKLLIQHSGSPFKLIAVHINHGLSLNADAWQAHCQQVCLDLGLEFVCRKVEIDKNSSQSLEKIARDARYRVFKQILEDGDFLLMGHHQNDQLETMLYRLMRGTGPRGLGAIPAQRKLAKGELLRPLLPFLRSDLEIYARANDLRWIEDESNLDTDFDRNFLRQKIFPLLKQRWPGFEKNWQRSAQLCAESDQLQTILGEQDLAKVSTTHLNRLDISAFNKFDDLRQRNILRVWFFRLEKEFNMPMPDFKSLERILQELLPASDDASPLVCWSKDGERITVRRFNGELYALKPFDFDKAKKHMTWMLNKPFQLSSALGCLSLEAAGEQGIDLSELESVEIGFRQGGEEVKAAGRKTRSLKKIFQDYKVPPWLRDYVPLIFVNGELVAVGDLFICEGWQTNEAKNLQRFCWDRSDIHCGY